MLDGKCVFSFYVEKFHFEILPGIRSCILTEWSVDPLSDPEVMPALFEQQLNIKRTYYRDGDGEACKGDILVSIYGHSVIDGASEIHSLGLIDGYDMPPIDTWFYILETVENERLLFSWIPGHATHYATQGVEVNCVDCINWFQEWYPHEYKIFIEK